jgi:diadenosine tetraphosphate (Ap4A) HIT family hydrolase
MPRSRIFLSVLLFLLGIAVGGWLFSDSKPRSFLAMSNCESCYRPSDLAGLVASAGIRRAGGALPLVVKETDRCIAIDHPFRKMPAHFVVFPKKDIKDIADVSLDTQDYVLDCLAVIRALVVERRLRRYWVETNGPGFQHVTYLHFHLVAEDGAAPAAAPAGADEAGRPGLHHKER